MAKRPEPEIGPDQRLVGYARVSTREQNLDLQIEALKRAGVRPENLHVEKVSAASSRRYALELAIKDLQPGDTFVVWRLDRLARSVRDFHKRLDDIAEGGAKFRSLTEDFDFGTFMGRFVLTIIAATAELERQLIAHRTSTGMQTMKAKGHKFGAKLKMTPAKIKSIKAMMRMKVAGSKPGTRVYKYSLEEIADKHGVSESSLQVHGLTRQAVVDKGKRK